MSVVFQHANGPAPPGVLNEWYPTDKKRVIKRLEAFIARGEMLCATPLGDINGNHRAAYYQMWYEHNYMPTFPLGFDAQVHDNSMTEQQEELQVLEDRVRVLKVEADALYKMLMVNVTECVAAKRQEKEVQELNNYLYCLSML